MAINYNEEDLKDHHAVHAIIKNSRGEVLMQDHVKYGFWTFPIGKAKDGQSPIDGIKEEILEECNIKIEKLKEIITDEITYDRNGNIVTTYIHVYEIIEYSGEIINNEPHKHREQKFVPLEEIKKVPYVSDSVIIYLRYLGFERKARL